MNYKDLVNAVLRRLRETECNSVQDTAYTKLIGDFVNETKREVEDAYDWRQLATYFTITTVAGTNTYTLTGSSERTRFAEKDQYNVTKKGLLTPAPINWMHQNNILTSATNSDPVNFAVDSYDDTTGEMIVQVYPTPSTSNSTLYIYAFNPQASLSSDTDNMKVPAQPVIDGAWARAISERGEDGGRMSDAQFSIYRSTLADYIAIASERDGGTIWEAV